MVRTNKKFKSHSIDHKKVFLSLVVVVVALILISAFISVLGGQSINKGFGQSNSSVVDGVSYGVAPSVSYSEDEYFLREVSNAGSNVEELTERKVVKNGNLDLVVENTEKSVEDIKNIVKSRSGFVENANVYESGNDKKSGFVTVRVPSDNFDSTMSEIKKLALKVVRENENARDVTEEFVDLEARLKNLKAEEEQYVSIMKRAYEIEDVLNVAKRLSQVRGNIERLEGQLKFLSAQIDMSSVTVSLTSEAQVEIFGIVWNPLIVAKKAFHGMLESLAGYVDALIVILFSIPIILLWIGTFALVIYALWKLGVRAKKRLFKH